MNWIKINDEWPETGQEVFVMLKNDDMVRGEWVENIGLIPSTGFPIFEAEDIACWSQLPTSLPKERIFDYAIF